MGKNISSSQKYCHFYRKTAQILHKTKVSFRPLFIIANLHSFPAKMITFIASKNIIFLFYGTKSLGENDKIFKNNHKKMFLFFWQKMDKWQ